MIELVCRLNKIDGDCINTVYADGKAWVCLNEDDANEMVQKNTVKNFITEETDCVYVERYSF